MQSTDRWTHLEPFEYALYNLFDPEETKTVVEVGVYQGGWIKTCLEYLFEDAKIYAVDPWKDVVTPHRRFRNTLAKELASDHVIEIRRPSLDAAKDWDKPIDLLHLDGDHTDLLNDLIAWVPKVREGGLITGHDVLGHRQSKWVLRDLHHYFGKHKPFFIGPIRGRNLHQALRVHSFWFWKDTPFGYQHSMRRKPKEKKHD